MNHHGSASAIYVVGAVGESSVSHKLVLGLVVDSDRHHIPVFLHVGGVERHLQALLLCHQSFLHDGWWFIQLGMAPHPTHLSERGLDPCTAVGLDSVLGGVHQD